MKEVLKEIMEGFKNDPIFRYLLIVFAFFLVLTLVAFFSFSGVWSSQS